MARMLKAGRYTKVITIQAKTQKTNSYGGMKVDWHDVATVRAAIEPLQGREYFSGPFQLGENMIRIRIRYREGIDRKMRVKYGDRVFDIYSVIDSREAHREIQLMCKEGEAYGQR
ncbi:phage head closure protein [Testudinibacter sp. P27/CKL/0425]